MEIERVAIIGGGPVGSFMAALVSNFGLPVTVYEKRENFTRSINVKIKKNFFQEVQSVCDKLGMATTFFRELNEELNQQKRLIPIRTLEEKLKCEAVANGATYICGEVKDFGDISNTRKGCKPLILDCSGRNSLIRCSMFGSDIENMETVDLDSLVYVNLKANIMNTNISLYPAMKNVNHIKLARLLPTKQDGGLTCVTIAATVSEFLADQFDRNYPDSNRQPLKPFCAASQQIPDVIFQTICALICPLMLQDNSVKLDTVEVRKIRVACGYAKRRSRSELVCLGDAAVHLAYFMSLIIGLKHALCFFIMLTNYCRNSGAVTDSMILCNLSINQPKYRDEYVIEQFRKQNPRLHPIRVKKTNKLHVYLVITKIMWFGCYSFDVKHSVTKQLTSSLGVYEHQIDDELKKLNLELEAPVSQSEHQRRLRTQFQIDAEMLKVGVVSTAVRVEYTVRQDYFMVVTKSVRYGCFTYDTATHEIRRITDLSGIRESEIETVLAHIKEKLSWDKSLEQFEIERQNDIEKEISSNQWTQSQYDFVADAVAFGKGTGIKLFEVYSTVNRGYAIYPEDNDFFVKCLEVVQLYMARSKGDKGSLLLAIQDLAQQAKIYHNNDILTKILCCPTDKLTDVEQLVKNRKYFVKGGRLENGEIKLKFALSCMADILNYARECRESTSNDGNLSQGDHGVADENFNLVPESAIQAGTSSNVTK